MKYQKLGRSDIEVSVISLGTWGLGGGSVWTDRNMTEEETKRLLYACRDSGINYIDTAPVYGTGISEELLGGALKGQRHEFVLQSKCSLNWRQEGGIFHYTRDGYIVENDTRANAVKRDVEDSLLRMQTDYLDSVIVHYVCDKFPVEETVGALEEMIREGKIRAYGLSNSKPGNLDEYMKAPTSSEGVSLVQEFFSLLSPFHGRDYFKTCSDYDVLFQTYGVLEEGFLTSPSALDRRFEKTDIRSRLPWTDPARQEGLLRAFQAWETIRAEHGCSFAVLAESWALAQFEKMNLLVGMRRPETVFDTVKSLDVHLNQYEIQYMEKVVSDVQVEVLDK